MNIYLATKAAMLLALEKGYESVAFPGMGTGTGGVKAEVAAKLMFAAIRDCLLGKREFPRTLWEAAISF